MSSLLVHVAILLPLHLSMLVILCGTGFVIHKELEFDEELSEKDMHPKKVSANFKKQSGFGWNAEQDSKHWFHLGMESLMAKMTKKPNENVAKNIIMFIGDGMSVPTITAARILKGQLNLQNGDYETDASLNLEKFPYSAVSKTYCTDSQTADSACSATALFCGVKNNIATLGVTDQVAFGDCKAQNNPKNHVSSIISWAMEAGMSTGIVTTSRITHATPAGTYTHSASRDWENDAEVVKSGQNPETCSDIAKQLIFNRPGKDINVLLGGGRREFVDFNVSDVESSQPGNRRDGQNLIDIWTARNRNRKGKYVWTRNQLLHVDTENTNFLLGLFSPSHLAYVDKRKIFNDPSLAEMTEIAIKILRKNNKGFFLLVEGGKIDMAHHQCNAKRALYETLDFDDAVAKSVHLTNPFDTTIVVTSDHAHTMTISGYSHRQTSIFGLAGVSDVDHLSYPILSYANGLGYRKPLQNGSRHDISHDDLENINYRQSATLPLRFETHGGDDVLIYAKGPYAHYFRGCEEQSTIPYILGYAACIGPGFHSCNSTKSTRIASLV